jgi:hypothetical protein
MSIATSIAWGKTRWMKRIETTPGAHFKCRGKTPQFRALAISRDGDRRSGSAGPTAPLGRWRRGDGGMGASVLGVEVCVLAQAVAGAFDQDDEGVDVGHSVISVETWCRRRPRAQREQDPFRAVGPLVCTRGLRTPWACGQSLKADDVRSEQQQLLHLYVSLR